MLFAPCWISLFKPLDLVAQVCNNPRVMPNLFKSDSSSRVLGEKALEQAGFEAESWGMNSRGKAERAKKVLAWQPHQQSLEDEVDVILKSEKAALDAR